ncbi:neuronal acetylcholine receptor subunit alpha-7-like, partial [Patella vulgata]|uniref:neuronal acetylcholine receptor subunit alpha-7-like n=1 Tax=Patella vulgata TaxID=6465 RepID=UPI0021803E96
MVARFSINELREKDQVLVSFGYIHLSWEDDFLSWNESAYGGIHNMVVPQKKVCNVVLETMVSDITEIDLVLSTSSTGEVWLDEYGANGQWNLISASIEKKDTIMKAGVYIKLTIQRRRIFYVLNIILPVLFLSFMGALVFMLPADAGEKISLAITILLAYIVFLTIVSESMPQTSLQVSILAVYLTVLVAMSALSVVLSILVLRIYYKDPNIPVPGY